MKPYETAHELKSKYDDFVAWNNGRYVLMAVAAVLSKQVSYPEQPLSHVATSSAEHDYSMDAARFEQWARVANKEFEERQSNI